MICKTIQDNMGMNPKAEATETSQSKKNNTIAKSTLDLNARLHKLEA
jgi:hypothetical protein